VTLRIWVGESILFQEFWISACKGFIITEFGCFRRINQLCETGPRVFEETLPVLFVQGVLLDFEELTLMQSKAAEAIL
jgi:hypothetical protein